MLNRYKIVEVPTIGGIVNWPDFDQPAKETQRMIARIDR